MGSMSNQWASEPIAIIGLSCKFAGDASSPEKLWEMLSEGRNGWSEIPSGRFNVTGAYHPNHEKISTVNVKGAHFIDEDVGLFDAAFFNYSAETASAIDPQFRLQLESAYEALENAGLPLPQIAGSNTSVYAGIFSHDYHEGLIRDEDQLPRFLPIGTFSAMSSNRISHFFDFKGASMTVDTGCSTTLVALHQAVQSLRNREADMSVVSGSNLLLTPDMFKVFGSLGMLSPDGKSFAFDSRAKGYGRGEGVATIVIKRLSDALAANDPVRAVLRETALNQDGKTETITSPSQAAQEALMRECYRRAAISPRDTQYFEAHGTGTPTGDPIEARAVAAVFGAKDRPEPLRIGSLKTNIGHTEAASGLASLIKVVLALEKGQIPPSINFDKPNPQLSLDEWRLKVPTELEPWTTAGPHQPRQASINNFGYGGSNAHIILQAADSWGLLGASKPKPGINGHGEHEQSKVLVVSARTEQGCQRLVSELKEYLQRHSRANPASSGAELIQNLSYTLGERRTRFPWVAAHAVRFQGNNLDEVIKAFDSPKFKPARTPTRLPRVGMVFTGQGAQWHAMGRELISYFPVYRASLEEAERQLKDLGANWSLIEELGRDAQTTKVNTTALSIPICVAVQIALVDLLQTWGIRPTAVTSHSSGEIAAAYAAGALTLRQAMACAYYRAVLSADAATKRISGENGSMVAVGLGAEEAQASYLNRLTSGGRAVIACVNSPQSVTVAGDVSAVQELEDMCNAEGVFARRLRVDTAYHSHHMLPLATPYKDLLRRELPDKGLKSGDDNLNLAFSSPVTGGRVTRASRIANPDHWVASMVQPVEFVDAFKDMVLGSDPASTGSSSSSSSIDVVLEVGPHSALAAPIREILSLAEFEGVDLPYWSCLLRKEHAVDTMLSVAISLLREGLPIDLRQINFPQGIPSSLRVLTDLPSYPWNHSIKHWQESRINRAIRARDQEPHDLLGVPVPGANPRAAAWRNIVRVGEAPWLRDHMVQDNIVYPGAGYICLAIEAIKQFTAIHHADREISGYRLRDVDILSALVVPDSAEGIEIQTTLREVSDRTIGARGWNHFEVSSVTADNRWTIHANGLVTVEFTGSPDSTGRLPLLLSKKQPLSGYTRHIDPRDMFASLQARGIQHGPKFRNTSKIVQDGKDQRAISHISIADTSVPKDLPRHHVLHPTTLDAVILSSYGALPGAGAFEDSAKVPQSIRKMWVSSQVSRQVAHSFQCDAALSYAGPQSFLADVAVLDGETNAAVLEVQGLLCQSLGRSIKPTDEETNAAWDREVCSKVEWAADLSLGRPQALAQVKQELSRPEDKETSDLVICLRRVCVYFCVDALSSLTAQDVAQLESHHVKFHKWMKDQVDLAGSGRLGPDSATWERDGPVQRAPYLARAAAQSVDGELICRLGPHITSMLCGQLNPLEVMMEEKLLYKYYANAVRMGPSLTQLANLLRRVVHKNPRARVLEIGAGTGGATRPMLKALGKVSEGGPLVESWHFTDISSGFFEAARTEFAEWGDFMHFDRLDIEKDPASQGFELGSYDIVVACQVLHATKSMARTMAHVHSLMKPGATLLLMETTQDAVDLQFIFGLLPGWWLSEEPERVSSPSLTVPFWDQILRGAGFSGIDLEIRDCESDDMYSISNIMSTVPLPQKPQLAPEDTVVVVSSSGKAPPADVVDALQKHLQLYTSGPVPNVAAIEATAQADAYSDKICVFVGELDRPILHSLEQAELEAIKAMATNSRGLLWVTRGGAVDCEDPELSMSSGLLRALRNEYVGRRFISLDLDPQVPDPWSPANVSTLGQVLEAGFGHTDTDDDAAAGAIELEYAERNGVVLIPRLFKDGARNQMVSRPSAVDWQAPDLDIPTEPFFQEDRPLRLQVGIPGLLDTLAFADHDDEIDPYDNSPLPSDVVEIEPRAYGLNFRDVMVAMGQLRERVMGLECSGIITRLGTEAQANGYRVGDRVMALLLGPFASRARISWHGVAHAPPDLSFEEAASLPMIFSTAYVSLVNIAHLQRGQSVLIHAAAGGVGQAAIMVAKHLGAAEIFVTVGSQEKRELIKREFGIPADRIFSSRDGSFAPAVLAATQGRGVDVVLNSLAGPLLQASFDVLAPFGHLVEIGKKDLEGNSLLEMGTFSQVASYTSLDMMTLLRRRGLETNSVLKEIARLVSERILTPVHPVTTYPMAQAAQAFRLLQTGKHTGKVVLSTGPEEKVRVLPRAAAPARLRPDASYILVGGTGGLGRSMAHWMVDHGARNLILLSRSAGNLTKTGAFVKELREAGCRVQPISCDVSSADSLSAALRTCEQNGFPPTRGVIQGAMVLQDSIFEQMSWDDWQICVQPKVKGTFNLHNEFSQPGTLDFFVMLSSLSGILGFASQANYAAAGAYQDALARWRQAHGLPGVSLDLGAVKGVGYVAETAGVADRMRNANETVMLAEDTVLRTLQAAILHPREHPQILLGLNSGPGVQWEQQGRSQMGHDARYLALSQGSQALAGKLAQAESRDTAERLVVEVIAAKLASIFMIPPDEIDLAKPPALYGVDSLVAVELRNMLVLQAAAEVSIFSILQSASLAVLASDVLL
ncbi:hypothetical protein DV738_g1896, partial [Chaetothyriales sp. CBS 135597]